MRTWMLLGLAGCGWFTPELERHCAEGGEGAGYACWKAGEQRLQGELVAKDVDKGRALLERGCELGEGEACLALGVALGEGVWGVPSASAQEQWTARSCQVGSLDGCQAWMRQLEARGDEGALRAARTRACQLGLDAACNALDEAAPESPDTDAAGTDTDAPDTDAG